MTIGRNLSGPGSVVPFSVLIAEDETDTRELLERIVHRRGARPRSVASAQAALEALAADDYDILLSDIHLGGESGFALCQSAVDRYPDLPVVLLTGHGTLDTAVGAIRAGAFDFLTKPVEPDVLWSALVRAQHHRRLHQEVQQLRRQVAPNLYGELLGGSAKMQAVLALLDKVGPTETNVLITGESGTGKELVAHALHQRSRPGGPFVVVNCAAIPEPLLESELFGHAKGAYTDARSARPGLFLHANGGTLFLDEIGELPLSLQPKLLRALQERRIRPVGSDEEVPFDARIVAATNRDLEGAVADRHFRKDLYFRINVIHVELPPLRERGGDVLLLAARFVDAYAGRAGKTIVGFEPEAQDRLMSYPWPGNVRELQNCVEHAVALAQGERIRAQELPARVRDYRSSHVVVASETPSDLVPLEEVEKRYILRVLEAVGGNKTLAARLLQLDRTTLYRKLARYGVK